mgnify:CR=1 FL=1
MPTQTLRIGIDSSGAVSGAQQVKRSLEDIQEQARRSVRATESLEASFKSLKNAASGLNGILAAMGLTASFTQMVGTIATFEKTMSGIKAVTKASAEEMDRMNKAARELGATTSFSATQAAEGMTFLGQAGFTTSQIIESMEPVLNLAAAGAMDLGKASEIAAGIMGGFRLQASDMANIADVLAAAASSGALDLTDLGFAMKYVGPVAASLGISLKDTAAAMVVLSNSGIKGEQAGTALRGMLSSLLDPSKQAEKDIKALGITFDDISPKTNTLAQIVEKLRVAGLDATYAFKLFGEEGAPAMNILTGNSAGLAKASNDLGNVTGEVKRMADVMSDNLKGDWDNLTGAIEELTLQIGEAGLLDALRAVTQTATGVVRVFAGMDEHLGEQAEYYRTLATAVEITAVAIGTTLAGKALGALITRAATAVQSQFALAAATTAAARATAENTAVEAAAAAAAVGRAQANVAGAQAALQMAIAQDKATGSMMAQRAAASQLAAANAQLIAAKAGATAAEAAHGAAIAATTVRARAATVAMKLLSGSMAFFGGPVGAAITALGAAVYYLQTRTSEAEKVQRTYNDRLSKLKDINAELITASGTRRAELENERAQILANADAEYELAKARLAGLKAFQESGKKTFVDALDTGAKRLDQAFGFKGAGVNDAVEGVASLPGMSTAGSLLGVTTSDMQLETTNKQIADTSSLIEKLEKDRASLRAEAGKPIAPLAGPPSQTPAGKPNDALAETDKVKARYQEQLREFAAQAEAVRRLTAAYAEGPEAVERETRALELLNQEQKLNSQFTAEQTKNLMGHLEALYGAEKAADVAKEIFNMDLAIRAQSDLNDAIKTSRDAEQSAAYAAEARAKAIELGVVTDQQAVDALKSRIAVLDQEKKYGELQKNIRSRDEEIDDTNLLAAAYLKEGNSVAQAQAAIQARQILMQQGIPITDTNLKQLTEQITKLQEANKLLEVNRRVREGKFDLEQGYAELEQLDLTGEAYYTATERLNMLMQKKRETGDAAATLTAEEEQLAAALGSLGYQSAIANDALSQMGRQTLTVQQQFRDMTAMGLGHFEDALVDLVTGTKSAKEAFADMAKSIANDLARMAIRMAIIRPLAMMFGGGMMGGAPAFGGFTTEAALGGITWAHTGGIVGADNLKTTNPFAGVPRFHTGGLAANETPAVLMKGEGVFTREQMKALAPVNNNNQSAPVTINVSVQQSQGGDPAAAEQQGQIIAKHVEMAMSDYITKQQRNGGQLNPNGGY